MTAIHPTAVVDPEARLAADVEIGPYAIVGPHVTIGEGTVVQSHVVLTGHTTIGARNRFFQFASIGEIPQDRKYGGEPTTTTIGDDNVFREYVSIHAGTAQDRGDTTIGSGNLFLAYTHIAHDCVVGNCTTWSNNAQIAGHVVIGDWVVMGAYAGVHQFCRVGAHAFLGAYTACRQDVLPFCRTDGIDAKTYGLNTIGLKRSGFSEERVEALQKAYRILVKSKLNTSQALERIAAELPGQPDVEELVAFIRTSERGFIK